MDNNELDTIDEQSEGLDVGQIGIGVGLFGLLFGAVMGIREWHVRRALKKEREKNVQYQEVIRKHQVEINELKSEKERGEYRDRLWAQIQAEMEE